MIYLCTPYSHPDACVMELRFDAACRIAGSMMEAGLVVYSPIAHGHPITVRCGFPRGQEFWGRFNRALLELATTVVVAKLNGWRFSDGVHDEIRHARLHKIPVRFHQPEYLLRLKDNNEARI